MKMKKMVPPDPAKFKDIDAKLVSFKEEIALEIDSYSKEMAAEQEKARNRLDEMELNTLQKAEDEWQAYEEKLAYYTNEIIDEASNRVDEIKKRVNEETVVEAMLKDALSEILFSFEGENKP